MRMKELRLSRSFMALSCGVLAASTLAATAMVLLAPGMQVALGAALFFVAAVWAVLAFLAGGFVGTWEAPTLISSLTGVDPAHVTGLRKKMSGPRSDVMLFAGVNAFILFMSAVVINLVALAALFILLGATLATAVLLVGAGSRHSASRLGG